MWYDLENMFFYVFCKWLYKKFYNTVGIMIKLILQCRKKATWEKMLFNFVEILVNTNCIGHWRYIWFVKGTILFS